MQENWPTSKFRFLTASSEVVDDLFWSWCNLWHDCSSWFFMWVNLLFHVAIYSLRSRMMLQSVRLAHWLQRISHSQAWPLSCLVGCLRHMWVTSNQRCCILCVPWVFELIWCICGHLGSNERVLSFLRLQNALKADIEKYGGKIANGVHEGNILLTSL